MTNTTTRFEEGKTYMMRSPCDYGCIWTVTVASRTEKTLTTADGKRLGIRIHDGVEHVFPLGTSLDDEWTERTVVEPRSRSRVLRAMARREKALATLARYERVIQEMLACDLYGELTASAEVL